MCWVGQVQRIELLKNGLEGGSTWFDPLSIRRSSFLRCYSALVTFLLWQLCMLFGLYWILLTLVLIIAGVTILGCTKYKKTSKPIDTLEIPLYKQSIFNLLFCLQVFWGVADHKMWSPKTKRFHSFRLVFLLGLPHSNRHTRPRYSLLLLNHFPEEMRVHFFLAWLFSTYMEEWIIIWQKMADALELSFMLKKMKNAVQGNWFAVIVSALAHSDTWFLYSQETASCFGCLFTSNFFLIFYFKLFEQ